MGAATTPPVASLTLGWFSTMTATTIVGLSEGAKATIHVCDVLLPVCAVPVLAATWTLGNATRVAVPCCTTPTIMSVMVEATSGVMGFFHWSGLNVSMT